MAEKTLVPLRNIKYTGFTDQVIQNSDRALLERTDESKVRGERRGGWLIWGSGLGDYARDFNFIPGIIIQSELRKTVDKGGKRYILDLMAEETAAREAVIKYGYEGGLVVSLGLTPATPLDSNYDVRIGAINEDLLRIRTWKHIRNWMNERDVDSFDTIMARPEGGLHNLGNNPAVHFAVLQRAWQLLSPDNGKLFFQIEWFMITDFILDLMPELIRNGVGVAIPDKTTMERFRYQIGVPAMLIKTHDSPKVLPSPKMLGIK